MRYMIVPLYVDRDGAYQTQRKPHPASAFQEEVLKQQLASKEHNQSKEHEEKVQNMTNEPNASVRFPVVHGKCVRPQ